MDGTKFLLVYYYLYEIAYRLNKANRVNAFFSCDCLKKMIKSFN